MEESSNNKTDRLCGICDSNRSKYCCPRCDVFYCSLDCYKSEKHLHCSESFYRDCVNEELSSYHAGDEAKQKMIDILKKVHNENINDELEDIDEVEDVLDSDDDGEIDLHERVKGLNLEDADAVWNVLTEDERNEFEALIQGEVGSILPQWEPWWMRNKKVKIIEEVASLNQTDDCKKCPNIRTVPKFHTLTKIQPSPAITFNIANILASYAFTMRYFNGEIDVKETVCHILDICTNLNMNTNFDELATAIESVAQKCLQSELIETDEVSLDVMRHDTFLILKGPSENNKSYYCKAALSDLIGIFSQAKSQAKNSVKYEKELSNNKGMFSKKFPQNNGEYLPNLDISKIKKIIKKLEFYLSFIENCDTTS
ncbi:zinc finger HIT domain-containing protein 2 [Battus philenor]|uniref:zinc finger HIT domain-containing protein 2 n=1 Tax=Battus philenor TaxID=42288 RepID=UPI0035CF2F9D